MRIVIRGRALGLDRRGRGTPLVLLHAFPVDRRMWDGVAAELRADADVVTVDFRGLGESEALAVPPSVESCADDVALLLDALGMERAVVGGLSMGGYVALAFAARHPGRLLGLALADTRAGADSDAQRAARDLAIARIARDGSAAYVAELVPKLVSARSRRALDVALALAGLQPPSGIAGALAALRDRPDRTALLASIGVPSTVIVGSEDAMSPPAEARKMAAAIAGATLVEIAGVGHLSALEAPAPFAEAVRALLQRVCGA